MLKKLAMKVYGLVEPTNTYSLRPLATHTDADRIAVLRDAGYRLIDDAAPNIYYAHRINLIKAIRTFADWDLHTAKVFIERARPAQVWELLHNEGYSHEAIIGSMYGPRFTNKRNELLRQESLRR